EELTLAQLTGRGAQLLLEPLTLDVSPAAVAFAAAHREELGQAGFDVESFGADAILVRSVPLVARGVPPLELVRAVIASLTDGEPAQDWRERIRIVASCKSAVRAGDSLSADEMLGLLERLGEKELCRTCSHGRPTALLLSRRELERQFGRR